MRVVSSRVGQRAVVLCEQRSKGSARFLGMKSEGSLAVLILLTSRVGSSEATKDLSDDKLSPFF